METHVHLHFLLLTFLKSVQKLHYIWITAELQEMIKGIRVLDGNHSCSSCSRPFESKSWWWTWEEELLWTGSLIWRYCEEKKDVNLSEMCCFFPQDLNYCPASVNPSWIICFPRTPTDKLTKAAQTGSVEGGSCAQRGLLSPRQPTYSQNDDPPPDPFSIRRQRDWLRRPEHKATTAGRAEYKIQHSPSSSASSSIRLLHLLSESAEPPAVARKHLSRVEFIPEKTQGRRVDAWLSEFFIHLSINWGIFQWCRPRIVHAGRPTRLSGAGLQHHQPVVHLLQDFLVDGLCDVCQLERVRCHVVDFYKHLQRTNNPGWDSNCFSPPRSWFYHQMAPQWGIF